MTDATTTDASQKPAPCEWCGHLHDRLCPYLKAVEFEYPPGAGRRIKRVEFLTPADYHAKKSEAPAEPGGDNYPKLAR